MYFLREAVFQDCARPLGHSSQQDICSPTESLFLQLDWHTAGVRYCAVVLFYPFNKYLLSTYYVSDIVQSRSEQNRYDVCSQTISKLSHSRYVGVRGPWRREAGGRE